MIVTLLRAPFEGATIDTLPCGGLNLEALRIGSDPVISRRYRPGNRLSAWNESQDGKSREEVTHHGRFPSNVLSRVGEEVLPERFFHTLK